MGKKPSADAADAAAVLPLIVEASGVRSMAGSPVGIVEIQGIPTAGVVVGRTSHSHLAHLGPGAGHIQDLQGLQVLWLVGSLRRTVAAETFNVVKGTKSAIAGFGDSSNEEKLFFLYQLLRC